jgi:hypothetical protein
MRWCRLTTNSSGGTLNSVSSPRRWTSQNSARASGDSLSIRAAISSSIISSKGKGPGHPEGYPGPRCTLYALASLRAAAARHALVLDDLAIKVVLGLDNAAKEHPAIYAGVGVIMISGGWVRWGRGRLFHVNTSCVLAAPPGSLDPPAGASYIVNSRIIPCAY